MFLMQGRLTGAEYTYYSEGKRDPFVPLVTGEVITSLGIQSVETIEDVKLEGIVFDPSGESIAVLNGEIVREGEKAYNVEIVKIYNNAVTLKVYNDTHTIDLIEKGGETFER
jgi:hypothetical protein